MAREELVNGLKNAVERGEPLEKAVQSFINAGYNPNEIKEAAGYINMGIIGRNTSQPIQQTPMQKQIQKPSPLQLPPRKEAVEQIDNLSTQKPQQFQPLPTQAQQAQQFAGNSANKPKRKFPKILIVLIILLAILIGGLVTFSILGERMLNAMFGK